MSSRVVYIPDLAQMAIGLVIGLVLGYLLYNWVFMELVRASICKI